MVVTVSCSGQPRRLAVCGHLLNGDHHPFVLVEAVSPPEPIEHTWADVPADGGLDHLVLTPARSLSLAADGIQHLVVELDGRGPLRHVISLPRRS